MFRYLENREQDNNDDLEVFMGCRESPREKRRGRIAYGRVELHDVDDDIMRVLLANVFLSVPRNLSSASRSGPRIEDRKRFDTNLASRLFRGSKPRHANENRKNSRRASRSFLFGACLSARSNKSLRVTVQRPQVSANIEPPSWNASRTLERLRSTEELQ